MLRVNFRVLSSAIRLSCVGFVFIFSFILINQSVNAEDPSDAVNTEAENHEYRGESAWARYEDYIAEKAGPDQHDKHPCYRPVGDANRIACSELFHQWRIALDTKWMVFVAWCSVVVGLVGLILVGLTVVYAKRANTAAQGALEAALEQTRQNRAYMILDQASLVFKWRSPEDLVFCCEWENHGQSPAIDVMVSYAFHRVERDEPGPVRSDIADWSKMICGDRLHHSIVGPQQSYCGGNPILLDPNLLSTDFSRIYMHVECRYSDVHGRKFSHVFQAFTHCVRSADETSVGIAFILPPSGEAEIT